MTKSDLISNVLSVVSLVYLQTRLTVVDSNYNILAVDNTTKGLVITAATYLLFTLLVKAIKHAQNFGSRRADKVLNSFILASFLLVIVGCGFIIARISQSNPQFSSKNEYVYIQVSFLFALIMLVLSFIEEKRMKKLGSGTEALMKGMNSPY